MPLWDPEDRLGLTVLRTVLVWVAVAIAAIGAGRALRGDDFAPFGWSAVGILAVALVGEPLLRKVAPGDAD